MIEKKGQRGLDPPQSHATFPNRIYDQLRSLIFRFKRRGAKEGKNGIDAYLGRDGAERIVGHSGVRGGEKKTKRNAVFRVLWLFCFFFGSVPAKEKGLPQLRTSSESTHFRSYFCIRLKSRGSTLFFFAKTRKSFISLISGSILSRK